MSQDPKRTSSPKEDATKPPAQDWEAGLREEITPESIAEDGDFEPDGELAGEDDDNPYQDSDEALPDDVEERVISRNPGKEGSRFDEV